MNLLIHELRLIARSKLSVATLLLLLGLTALAVYSGLHEVARQQHTIARLAPLSEADMAAVFARHANDEDAGYHAYYSFYNTWDAPSNAAFLALGLRDVAPYVLRVRALGLQAQLYEGETFNPELALPGRFDFAFVLIYLAPLFVIALLHDLVSTERQAGRLRWLLSLSGNARFWWWRIGLRYALLCLALLIPVIVGALVAGTEAVSVAIIGLLVVSYVAFWCGVCVLIARCNGRCVTNATALMGLWALLTLILPTLANVLLTRSIPVHQGVDLMLAQREAIHGAWEIPREDTLQKFFVTHPKWKNTPPLSEEFHWKWYFAFHQVGDESVAEAVADYRAGLLARQRWTNRLGWALPGVAIQALLHRVANTDLQAQLAYQDRIADFHRDIRFFYYDYLFYDRPFGAEDFVRRPVFPSTATHSAPMATNSSLWLLVALSWGVLLIGLGAISKQNFHHRQ